MSWLRGSAQRSDRRGRRRSRLALLLAAALGIGALAVPAATMTVATPAAAAEGTAARVTSVNFSAYAQSNPINNPSFQELTLEWEVDDYPTKPVTLTFGLPANLPGVPGPFAMMHDGEPAGTCELTKTQLFCTLSDGFLATHQTGIKGSVKIETLVELQGHPGGPVIFDFGDEHGEITIEVNEEETVVCKVNCDWTGQDPRKDGSRPSADGTIHWNVYVKSGPNGTLPVGATVKLTELLDLNEHTILGEPTIYEARETHRDASGYEGAFWVLKPKSEYTVSADNRYVEFTVKPGLGEGNGTVPGARGLEGSVYFVKWATQVKNFDPSARYTNAVHWEIGDEERDTSYYTVTSTSGSGTVVGSEYGKFTITKHVEGDIVPPFDSLYTVKWTVTDAAGQATSHSKTVRWGASFTSPAITEGSKVKITEVEFPEPPAGTSWGTPKFLPANDFGVPTSSVGTETVDLDLATGSNFLGKDTQFVLVNTLADEPEPPHPTTSFGIVKRLDGDAAHLVDADTEYPVTYSWAADPDGKFDAFSDTINLTADGTRVVVDDVPAGAKVTFAEGARPDIDGATWATPKFVPSSLDAAEGVVGEVELTNSITLDEVPPYPTTHFTLVKKIKGDGAKLVKPEAQFTVRYSWKADEAGDFAEGEGFLYPRADGVPVKSNDVPLGAQIKLEEMFADVAGGTWGTPEFSHQDFTPGLGANLEVTVTNFFTRTPTPDPKPDPDPDPKPEPKPDPKPDPKDPNKPTTPTKTGLANTGSDSGAGMLLGATGAVLLLGGLAVSIRARRNRSETGQ
ncbi:hypothetical protein ICM05_05250 [Leucobacter sp. cx-42]|uniref:DUF5979 domain-containing protein n=1 Tax=unclassified Leucobacter TaxID=2621730 RepID=UPI00165D3B28|nr:MULTISPECIES: DUF5979 domain-containing protein [unclassified Leucobacter]MBC9954052.1 hypothetical protein [Leucobacter sp. cx-42]